MYTANSRRGASYLESKRNYPTFKRLIWTKVINKTLPFNRETKSLSLFLPAFLLDLLKVKLIFWCRIKCLLGTVINTRLTLKEKYFSKIKTLYLILFSLNKRKQSCVVYTWYYSLGISTGSTVRRLCWLQRLQQLFMTSDLILGIRGRRRQQKRRVLSIFIVITPIHYLRHCVNEHS